VARSCGNAALNEAITELSTEMTRRRRRKKKKKKKKKKYWCKYADKGK
jgi:hypothetical protein